MKRFLPIMLAACMVFLALTCGEKQPPAGKIPREAVSLGIPLQPTSALIIVAHDRGFFAEEGLDVRVHEYPSGQRAMSEGFWAGQVDAVSASDVPIVFNSLERSDFKVVAAMCLADNIPKIVARRDRIRTPGDLKGKRIGTQKASAVHYFLYRFKVKNGLNPDDIEVVFMKAEDLPKALADGSIDAFSMREPYCSQAAALLGGNIAVFEAPGLYSMTDFLVVSDKLANERPEAVKKLVKALLRADEFVKAHPEEAISIVSRRIGSPEPEVAALFSGLRFEVSLRQAHLTGLEDIARWAVARGLTDRTTIPNYLDFIRADALEEVRPEAVTIIR